jgi:EAL domain-containing protein (putative c-di-GMP-specific phosphodiesterase class I)
MADNRLLIVDDEEAIAEFIRDLADELGYTTHHVATIAEFDRALVEFAPTAITLDMNLPDGDGVELLRRLAERASEAAVLIVSGVEPRTLAMLDKLAVTRRLKLLGVLAKPVVPEELCERLRCALRTPSVSVTMLEQAIAEERLEVHYQPRVHLRATDWPIVGCEAFLRWNHAERGNVRPLEVLDVARANGLMPRLTDYVLERSIQQLSVWRQSGINLSLTVNFDPRLVDDFHFADRLVAMLREYAVPPQALTLDLTELAGLEDPDLTASVLTRLRIYGINLALDDFGVGYSSLTQLRSLPFSEVKIARELMAELGTDSDGERFVALIIGLCRSLGFKVCAEGVESWAAVESLLAADCDDAQGYMFGHPMRPTEFIDWLRHWDGRVIEGTASVAKAL